ncbi:MAG: phosphoribosyl-AMP cyclohydrolase [Parvibaculum sp.]|uniref:phosphoribosyl-AMP cyclohydrolase n=1 Tax=Parvibaculum sp. TaxID=2024848 RepID=UPI0025E59B4F|nr:phosphoribosyl-AMP cyclohydrolase [Parvibaculum sp.]MCE9651311.1 phosphoribosyl-AMP cyclohydrolase [Parvibaculum sp.]
MSTSPLFSPRGQEAEIEEGTAFAPKFDADGLIPAVATDATTGEVLMFAWMNAEALEKTIRTGEAWYWSRSRNSLWRKGETSGQTQTVRDIRIDCDQDALLLKVDVGGDGGACHVGYRSCFYRSVPVGAADGPLTLHIEAEKLPGHKHS